MALSARSIKHLVGVHPSFCSVILTADTLCPFPFDAIEGVRTRARQIQLFARGRETAELIAAGITGVAGLPDEPKVTWTLKSAHIPKADGFGYAVDMVPMPVDWKDFARFDALALAMFRAASVHGVHIRWGADWDGDGKLREKGENDSPHFELVG